MLAHYSGAAEHAHGPVGVRGRGCRGRQAEGGRSGGPRGAAPEGGQERRTEQQGRRTQHSQCKVSTQFHLKFATMGRQYGQKLHLVDLESKTHFKDGYSGNSSYRDSSFEAALMLRALPSEAQWRGES